MTNRYLRKRYLSRTRKISGNYWKVLAGRTKPQQGDLKTMREKDRKQ